MKFSELKVKDVHCVVRYVPRQKKFRTRGRNAHIVGIMLRGNAFHDLGYKSFTLTDGSAFFLNQRDEYDAHILNELEDNVSLAVHFTTYEPIDEDSFCVNADSGAELLRLLEKTEIKSRQLGLNSCMTVSILYRLCGELAKVLEKPYSQKDSRASAAREYIDTHFCERDCLARSAELAGVSSRRFNDIFKSEFNITPNRYVVLKKVGYAGELLRTGSFSVSEVAELCGFCDVYYFSRVFKTEMGVSPKEWK